MLVHDTVPRALTNVNELYLVVMCYPWPLDHDKPLDPIIIPLIVYMFSYLHWIVGVW